MLLLFYPDQQVKVQRVKRNRRLSWSKRDSSHFTIASRLSVSKAPTRFKRLCFKDNLHTVVVVAARRGILYDDVEYGDD